MQIKENYKVEFIAWDETKVDHRSQIIHRGLLYIGLCSVQSCNM